MLGRLIDQVKVARRVNDIVVATSQEQADDAIAAFCNGVGVRCFRGSLSDVAGRFLGAAQACGVEEFTRISGDSPLMTPAVVDDVIALYDKNDVDLATNVQKRTFPKGFSVEVIRVEALQRARKIMDPDEFEHVTTVFYRRPQDFRVINLSSGHDWGEIQMSVDTLEDFALVEKMFLAMSENTKPLNLEELVELRARCVSGAAA